MAEHYGESGQRVYSHIADAVGFPMQVTDRDYFKAEFSAIKSERARGYRWIEEPLA